jgi:squalene-associated FAD-dependent desaturase
VARTVAVIGAGWAGLAAAIEATASGARVILLEMAPSAGGRARDVGVGDDALDNGQHIAIGAYVETLRLLRKVGVDEADAFLRLPLRLVDAEGAGLLLPAGRPMPAFVRGVLAQHAWPWRDRVALLARAVRWAAGGFACDPRSTVDDLCAGLPRRLRDELVDPLCVAALNTPAGAASGEVFLRVLHDALASGRGASDLLLPRRGLGSLLPGPALTWLRGAGAEVRLGHRVERIARTASGWELSGLCADAVVVAASAAEAGRLIGEHDPRWSGIASALTYEPIVTVYARSGGTRLPEPMLVLHADASRPAQFVFDRGQLGGPPGLLAFVASGAAEWVERGLAATEAAALAQGSAALAAHLRGPLEAVRTIVEKRATFRCVPGLDRPPLQVAPGLVAAGDYVAGPYPATLEGAVRSGVAAARAVGA